MRSLRVAFFGTPELAVPTLARLADGPHEVVCVVTQPDRARGRGRRTSPSPVAEAALARGLPVLRPEKIGDEVAVAALRAHAPDVGVVVAYGQFLPKKVRELPSCGFLVNAHASLLPKLRGAAPIARAILDGETRTGISVMRVEREMDAGPVALVRELAIGDDENTEQLETRLGALAADAIAEALDLLARDALAFTPQDDARATLAPKLERAEAELDWRAPARELARRVRAFAPRPGATTALDGEPLRVLAADVDEAPVDRAPGTVRLDPARRDAPLAIATGDGWLRPRVLQRAGGKALDVAAFLRGRPLTDGVRLADAPSSPAHPGRSGDGC
ncbi:MAG: methionyl-tRNA formyltransferase [Myxococcota bacterium]